jgi:hypothetical protein
VSTAGPSNTCSNAAVIESECARRAGRPAAVAAGGASGGSGAVGGGGAGAAGAALAGARGGAGIAGAGKPGEATGALAGDLTGALGAGAGFEPAGDAGAAGVRPPRDGAGGGDSTIVGSRSLLGSVTRCAGSATDGWVRGTLGNAPARVGVRGSGGAGGGAASEAVRSLALSLALSLDRRDSRPDPGHSQIERGLSVGVCETDALVEVANAGVNPGNAGGLGATGSVCGGAFATDAAAVAPGVTSGSSFIALPSSSPAEASAGCPS